MKDYEKLIKIVPSNMKPRLTFNKRIDKLYNKLDLVYIDGVYKQTQEEQERRDEQNKKNNRHNNQHHNNQHHNNSKNKDEDTIKKIKYGGFLDSAGCIVIL
uniref:Uncharacterized protein n=1 Tax=viral metagenome TaxID=1070528 RepID=A0A6C0BE49_9ZZZZ